MHAVDQRFRSAVRLLLAGLISTKEGDQCSTMIPTLTVDGIRPSNNPASLTEGFAIGVAFAIGKLSYRRCPSFMQIFHLLVLRFKDSESCCGNVLWCTFCLRKASGAYNSQSIFETHLPRLNAPARYHLDFV